MLLAGLLKDNQNQAFKVERWFSTAERQARMVWCVRTDASPFGMGGILYRHGLPFAWCAVEWDDTDRGVLKAEAGSAAWQAEWELLALLIAIDTWLPRLRCEPVCLVQTDATAALYNTIRMAGRTPAMNALAAEVALRLESAHVSAVAEHISGTLNFHCDALSRLAQGAAVPQMLQAIQRDVPKPRTAAFFWAWPRALLSQPAAQDAQNAAPQTACRQGAFGKMGRPSQPSALPDWPPSSRARARVSPAGRARKRLRGS
jgi:hypothetical protein